MSLSSTARRVAAVHPLTQLTEVRARRARVRLLRAELESYRTPAERAELAAILGRQDGAREALERTVGRSIAA